MATQGKSKTKLSKKTKPTIAIIGGSGLYALEKTSSQIKVVKEHSVTTPFGPTSDKCVEVLVDGHPCYFLARHGRNHAISPSEINYRANIFALKKLGVSQIISISAVGSLKEEYAPGLFVLPDQFIDWTKGLRERTFFDKGIVGHVSTALPVELELQKALGQVCKEIKLDYKMGGSYVCIEGPQFSTKAESNIYRSFGAGVIGMTNVPEAFLAKEAGMAYATVAMVTDYDCWKEEHCSLEEIMNVMKGNNLKAQELIKAVVPYLYKNPIQFKKENQYCIVTKPTKILPRHKKILDVVLG